MGPAATVLLPLLAAAVADPVAIEVTDYPALPVIDFEAGTSPWQFSYNPAYCPGPPGSAGGLMVRVQNGTSLPPGQCGHPATESFLVWAAVSADGTVSSPSAEVVFGPVNTSWEQTAEDPRTVYDASSNRWVMTYTANGDVAPFPINRHQGIAISTSPSVPGSWHRLCSVDTPCLPPGYKSGAMLLRPKPPHYMFVYNLTGEKPGVRDIVVATSDGDLSRWTLSNRTLLPRRPGMWDAGLVEPGPPAFQLASGDWLFFYNAATFPNDRQYHVGFAVLDRDDPGKVLQRSAKPVLSWSDRPWMEGNTTRSRSLCYTPQVVFCNGARLLPDGRSIQLFFGAADAVVGTATVTISTLLQL